MVIPWAGFPLAKLLEKVEPNSQANFVRSRRCSIRSECRSAHHRAVAYEGLRLDEATSLTILATGLYGQTLPPQDGAPIRLVVPWSTGSEHQIDRQNQFGGPTTSTT
jgi:sulfoxide reductase catalytic subunit YedY